MTEQQGGLRRKDSDHLHVLSAKNSLYGIQSVTLRQERGETCLPLETAGIPTQCASSMFNSLLVLISGGLPSRDSSGCWVFNPKRKISHKSS